MTNLKTALKAFWVILRDKPHVYCDDKCHSITGTASSVESSLELLVDQYNNAIEQENVLYEAKKIID